MPASNAKIAVAAGPRHLLDRRLAMAPQIHRILREALLRLEADGLIDVYPQSRTEVSPISLDELVARHPDCF